MEQVTEVLLDQALPRLTPAQYYVLLDALCDNGCGRFSRSRYQYLAGSRRSDGRTLGWFSDHHFPDLDDRPGRPEQPMADKPVIKIDNSIVNNFECGYHLKNAGSLSKKHADAACIVAANGGKWHEESSQGFRHQ
jgi:hypothetical protein